VEVEVDLGVAGLRWKPMAALTLPATMAGGGGSSGSRPAVEYETGSYDCATDMLELLLLLRSLLSLSSAVCRVRSLLVRFGVGSVELEEERWGTVSEERVSALALSV
jgi:hypothetical protein